MEARVRRWRRAAAAATTTLVTSLLPHVMLARYLLVGGLVGLADLLTMKLLLRAGFSVLAATTISYLVMGVGLHFTLNKSFTFRNRERATLHLQIRTYAIVTGLCYLSTIAIVESFAHAGASPLAGKIVGILVNVPLAFFCNRTFTFAPRATGGVAPDGTARERARNRA